MRLEPRLHSITRCALCHDVLVTASAWQCVACGTVLHGECRAGLPRCPTLGCRERVPGRRAWWLWCAAGMGAVLILAAGVTFMWALTGMVERRPYAFTGRELLPEPPAGTSVRPEPEWKRTAAFDALVARGCELCRAGDHDEAIATLTSAILLDATSPHAWYVFANRSVAHAALGHGERALLDAQEAMLIDPGRAEGLVYSGYARSVLHEDEKAIADYRRALAGLGERSELAAWCRDALATLEARQRSH